MATQDFSMKAGDTKLVYVTVRNPNTQAVVDITGATLSWKAYRSQGRTAVLSLTPTISDATGGVFLITITAGSNTSSLKGDYVHEWKITFADGTILRGGGRMTVELAFNV